MKTLPALVCVVGVSVALPQVATAQESFVACPVASLDAAVVSALPDGWWTTPQRGDLLSTEVRVVGGQQTLVCNYAGFGTAIPVMRELPAGVGSCTAAAGGFNCGTHEQVLAPISGPSAPVRTSPDPIPADRKLKE